MIDLMRLAGYTALLPANHEFDFGAETLKRRQTRGALPFLGTNLSVDDDETAVFSKYLLIETAGPRIGVLGLLSQEVAILTNPEHFNGIQISDPLQAAGLAIEILQRQGADYIIALTHMKESEALAFARQAKSINLVIAGGYRDLDQAGLIPSLIRLVNGTQIVTTPGFGRFLGQVTVQFVRQPAGGFLPAHTDVRLHAIDFMVPDDLDAATLIARTEDRYAMAAGDTIGLISGDTHQSQARMIARLMRRHTDAEIGILNLGLIQQIPTAQPLIRRHISRFILPTD